MNRGGAPGAVRASAAAGLAAWLVLFGSVQVGLALPGREVLASAVVGGELDYGRVEGTVAPLTDAFVAQALGLPPPAPDRPPAAVEVATPAGGSAVDTTAGADAAEPGAPPGTRVVVTHPPDNDHFAEAYEVPSVPFTANTDASRASREPGEPSCAPTGPTLWYRYTAERTLGLTAHVVARNSATALGVFVGSSLDDLALLGCDDTLSGASGVRFPAEHGNTYFFQVSAPLGAREIRFALDPLGTTSRMPAMGGDALADASCGLVNVPPEPTAHEQYMPTLSTDGRFVVFESRYSETWPYRCWADWPPVGRHEYLDVFVHDRATGVTEMVSVSSDGEPGNERSGSLVRNPISADGCAVAFWSRATNLVPDDTNGEWDLFVRDRCVGETTRVSVSSDGRQAEAPPPHLQYDTEYAQCETFGGRDGPPVRDWCHWLRALDMTPDGRYVVFWSDLHGLVEEPDGAARDDQTAVYRHDRVTGETIKVSLPEQSAATLPSISADGHVVTYRAFVDEFRPLPGRESYPSRPWDQQAPPFQVWARDLRSGETILVTRGYDGQHANGGTFVPVISDDGRSVAYSSSATNLVPGDLNGVADVFVHDLQTGETEMASVNTAGEPQAAEQQHEQRLYFNQVRVSISGDGRYVAFDSAAGNLAPDDPEEGAGVPWYGLSCPSSRDAFVHDRTAGTTTMVSVSSAGESGNDCTLYPYISADGGTVAFMSLADNLAAEDAGGLWGFNLFFHDFAGLL